MSGGGARSPEHRIPRGWLLALLALGLVAGAVALDWLSPALVVDLVAWWPIWLGLVLLAYLVRGRNLGRVRLSGLVPLLTLGLLAVLLVAHLSGWAAVPSGSARLVGPEVGDTAEAALSARPPGSLEVTGADLGFLYVAEPIRRGGEVALPSAREQSLPGQVSVSLEPVEPAGWYRFAGWRLRLAAGPTWNLALGGEVDADLTALALSGLQLQGSGRVGLGSASTLVSVTVAGDFRLSIPSGQPARVVGEARVPGDWVEGDEGLVGPAPGEGWVIAVAEGATLTVDQS